MQKDELKIVIAGTLIFRGLSAAQHGFVEVRLLDAALEGAPAVTIASTWFKVTGDHLAAGRIPFRLRARVTPERDYAVAAELRRHCGRELRPGDLLTTERMTWRSGGFGPFDLRLHPTS